MWDIGGRITGGDIGNSEIRFLEGSYRLQSVGWPRSSLKCDSGWVVLRPADGIEAADVRMMTSGSGEPGDPAGRTFIEKLRISGMTLGIDPNWRPKASERFVIWGGGNQSLWIDGCKIEENFVLFDDAVLTWGWGVTYSTDSEVVDCYTNPLIGRVCRNNSIDGLLQDALRAGLVANVTVRRQDRQLAPDWMSLDIHSDVWQVWNFGGVVENNIVVGLEATDRVHAQGIFTADANLFRDHAFKDVRINNTYNGTRSGMHNLYWCALMKHVLVLDSEFTGGFLRDTPLSPWNPGDWVADDVVLRNVGRIDPATSEPTG
ncbi:MAG: hypothetical protein VYE42_04380, partial [Actinomycetota bacterium]|nr:hypothetical protein [Actinomycetota bacterium]